jgi:hypothetical protein
VTHSWLDIRHSKRAVAVLLKEPLFLDHARKGRQGLAYELQATTRDGSLSKIELPPLVPEPDFWYEAGRQVGLSLPLPLG